MSQGSLALPTTGTVSGLSVVQDVNAALAALVSANSGAGAPANPAGAAPVEGQFWLDTSSSPHHVRMYDGSNWLDLGVLDTTEHVWAPPLGGGIGSLTAASTCDLGSVGQAYVAISGSTTIAHFGASMLAGTIKFAHFVGSLTLTHNGTSLILPGAADIVTAAGDSALVVALGGGNHLVAAYQRASGAPLVISAASVTGAMLAAATVANSNLAAMAAATLKGNNTASTGAPLDLTAAQARAIAGITLRGQLFGLTLSNDGTTPASVLDVAAGEAASDSATPTLMVLGSAITKSLASNWAVGTGNGGLDTGAVGNNSYHVFLIMRPDTGVVDVLFSLSATAPTMPANYTLKRRIGSITRSGGSIDPFTQTGDKFQLKTPSADFNNTNFATAQLVTLGVPSGIVVDAMIRFTITAPGAAAGLALISPIIENDTSVTQGHVTVSNGPGTISAWEGLVQTDTSGRVRFRANVNSFSGAVAETHGWVDSRGRLN